MYVNISRWSSPELSSGVQRVIVELCHLILNKKINEKSEKIENNSEKNTGKTSLEKKSNFRVEIDTVKSTNNTYKLFLVWYAKSKGSKSEKLYEKIMILLTNLKNSLKIKNEKISNKAIKTEKNVKTIIFKNKGKIQWMVENNLGEKDKYWTLWYLAAKVCVYMCIYVHMYVDKCIYIHVYVYVFKFIFINIY
jgi:prophage maintenance system killer protein